MSWITQHFFNPVFVLPGAALIASPIIIHLINRLRYRRVRFAAMEFLLQSDKRNRRRIMLEQLLLLLLRILLVMAAVALIARLILDPSQLAMFHGAKAHHVILLDDSGSMRDRLRDSTAFDHAVEVVERLIAEGANQPNTQKLTLVTLSNPDQPLFTERDVNDAFLDEVRTKLNNVSCTQGAVDMDYAVQVASQLLSEERAAGRYVHFVTDFRARDWTEPGGLASVLEPLDEAGIRISIVRTVTQSNDNLAITRLETRGQTSAAGVPIRFQVAVRNFGTIAARDVGVAVLVDGERLPSTVTLDRIEPDEEVATDIDVTIDEPGLHSVQARLESDALTIDNHRFVAVDIAVANPVLIVDGSLDGLDASLVADALAADPSLTGIAPTTERVEYLRTQPLDRFGCIFMLNVAEVPEDAVESLKQFVSGGGGLAWFTGDLVQPAFYNSALFAAGNTGLFPVPLGRGSRQITGRRVTQEPDLVLTPHPVFRIFEGQDNPFIEGVRIDTYSPVRTATADSAGADGDDTDSEIESWIPDDNERKDGVRTIATLSNGDPLAFEHRFGRGRVLTFLTSAGPAWNNWSRNPSFVVAQLELQKHLAREPETREQRIVGDPIHLSLSPAEYSEQVEFTSPKGGGDVVERVQAAPPTDAGESDGLALVAGFTRTGTPGIYRIRTYDHNQTPSDQWFAYNVSTEESNLAVAEVKAFREQLKGDSGILVQDADQLTRLRGQDAGHEFRRILLGLVAVVLILEQLLALRLSYHSQPAGALA